MRNKIVFEDLKHIKNSYLFTGCDDYYFYLVGKKNDLLFYFYVNHVEFSEKGKQVIKKIKEKLDDLNWYVLKFPVHETNDNSYLDLKECMVDGVISEETYDKIENIAVKEAMKTFLNKEYMRNKI
ncbi:hypothetical protein [Dubosiella newyorkensis]|uniref:hypothetical protein n=1 Tax=Dubosiella newyorkensis TaxID=1862672 RepID=UPI00272A771A|nr:hypothetical protein [Dubosiella newyorkensis]